VAKPEARGRLIQNLRMPHDAGFRVYGQSDCKPYTQESCCTPNTENFGPSIFGKDMLFLARQITVRFQPVKLAGKSGDPRCRILSGIRKVDVEGRKEQFERWAGTMQERRLIPHKQALSENSPVVRYRPQTAVLACKI